MIILLALALWVGIILIIIGEVASGGAVLMVATLLIWQVVRER